MALGLRLRLGLALLHLGARLADQRDLLVGDDQLGVDAELVGIDVGPLVAVELVEHVGLELGDDAEVADEAVGRLMCRSRAAPGPAPTRTRC
jgi:hypothetical protein